MKEHDTEFADFLNSAQQLIIADLYTFTIQRPSWDNATGLVFEDADYRYTSFDRDVIYNGAAYSAAGLLIERGTVRSVIGMEVDAFNMRVFASETMTMAGMPFLQAAIYGTLDGARVKLDRLYMDSDFNPRGTVNMFSGRVATVEATRTAADIEVRSDVELLNIKMPRSLYQPGCQHTLYDQGCTKDRLAYAAQGTVTAGSGQSAIFPYGLPAAAPGWWDLGGILFTSGRNANLLRTVKAWDGGALSLVSPLPYAPASGDTFVVYPGCDKTQSTCQNKFDNVINFKGFPYIPQPETMR